MSLALESREKFQIWGRKLWNLCETKKLRSNKDKSEVKCQEKGISHRRVKLIWLGYLGSCELISSSGSSFSGDGCSLGDVKMRIGEGFKFFGSMKKCKFRSVYIVGNKEEHKKKRKNPLWYLEKNLGVKGIIS